jgi:hypothetical protein
MLPTFLGSRRLSSPETPQRPFELREVPCLPLAGENRRRTCSSMFEKRRLDPCSPAFRGRRQGRVRSLRLLQMHDSTSTTTDHSNIPTAGRGDWDGCQVRSKVTSRSGEPPKVRRVRGRAHRVSTLPAVIAHDGDFAPTPIAPGTSCRTRRPLPCLESTGEETGSATRRALARRARRKGRAAPGFREEVRRSPTRGAFHR